MIIIAELMILRVNKIDRYHAILGSVHLVLNNFFLGMFLISWIFLFLN